MDLDREAEPSEQPPDRPPYPAAGETTYAPVYPWRRFFARTFDLYIFAILLGAAIELFLPDLFENENRNTERIFSIVTAMVYIPFDAAMSMAFGSTLGKFLYRMKIESAAGLTLWKSLKRAFLVWLFGFGAGLPIVSLLTLLNAYSRLSKEQTTSWDEATGCRVVYARISAWRWIGIALAWLLPVAAIVYGGNY